MSGLVHYRIHYVYLVNFSELNIILLIFFIGKNRKVKQHSEIY